MKRILLNGLHYEKNGAGISKYAQKLMQAFSEGCYPVDILIRGEVMDEFKIGNAICVDKDLSSSSKRILEEQWGSRTLYKACDLVHFPDYATPIFYSGQKIATIHDMAMHTMKDKYTIMQNITKRTLLEYTVRRASYLICDSEFAKRELYTYYPNLNKEVSVIHLGVEIPKLRVEEKEARQYLKKLGIKEQYILYVGTLAPHKNIENLIRAFAIIKHKYPSYQLVVAGKKGWMYEGIFNCTKELGLEEDVIFTGFINELTLEALYQQATCYVNTSLYEGFGLPPLEAMVRGCPVVVSDLEIFKETCGESVLFCDPIDVKHIAQQIEVIITNPELREKLSILGKEHVKQFTWQETARKTFEVYEHVLK